MATIHGWFDEAALQSYGYPTDEVCRAFAVTLKRAANHAANAQLEKDFASREPSILASKDVTPDQIISMRWRLVREAANHLAYALAQFEEFVPRQKWDGHCGFSEVSAALDLMSAYPEEPVPPPPPPRGPPRKPWHKAARVIFPQIQIMLQNISFEGRMEATDHESATAIIGAAAISWAYCIEIQPEGFASAMRGRDRRREGKPRFAWEVAQPIVPITED